MTPEAFSTAAIAWIGAIVAVTLALLGALAVILPKLADLHAKLEDLKGRQDRDSNKLAAQAAAITMVALATTTPPGKAQPQVVGEIINNPPAASPSEDGGKLPGRTAHTGHTE